MIAARATKKVTLRVAALSSPNFSLAPPFWYRHHWQFLRLGNATSSALGMGSASLGDFALAPVQTGLTHPEGGEVSCDFG